MDDDEAIEDCSADDDDEYFGEDGDSDGADDLDDDPEYSEICGRARAGGGADDLSSPTMQRFLTYVN